MSYNVTLRYAKNYYKFVLPMSIIRIEFIEQNLHNIMRIISGKYKGRHIPTMSNSNCRPTSTSLREAVFSIMTSGKFSDLKLKDAIILDLFCGSGALGYEALSREAEHVYFVDCNLAAIRNIEKFADMIGASRNITTLAKDVRFLTKLHHKIDMAFIDPPYAQGLVDIALERLARKDILANNAYIFIESEKQYLANPLNRYTLIDQKIYSQSKLTILQYEQTV